MKAEEIFCGNPKKEIFCNIPVRFFQINQLQNIFCDNSGWLEVNIYCQKHSQKVLTADWIHC